MILISSYGMSVAPYLSPNTPIVSTIPSSIDNPSELPTIITPLWSSPSNYHPMLTRSKIGHSNPKLFLAHSSTNTTIVSCKEAANIS